MELEIYNISGTKTGKKVTVDESIFGIEPHEHSMWLMVKAILANRRQGNHSTKGRSEVAGSTKKMFRQKGTGRARQGDIKSPLHPGGGTMFGPKTHKHALTVPRKVKQLARKSALSQKVKTNAFYVVEDFNMNEIKTKNVANMIGALGLSGTDSLILTANYDQNVYMSGRNIPAVTISEAAKASTYDIWRNRAVVVEASALRSIENSFKGVETPETVHISVG
jgi:large subunit ribosomal protein L4